IQQLFPHRPSKPNHHYTMHNGAHLKYWGPLASFSEFPGEEMNGKLQKMNTNYHLLDLDLTMLRQMSHQACVDALLHSEDLLKELCDILEPTNMAMDDHPVHLWATEVADILAKAPCLLEVDYHNLLDYLHQTGRPY
ncbi:hypothetical protein L208DRAFT_1235520, partial [Tricholoma matsutake]